MKKVLLSFMALCLTVSTVSTAVFAAGPSKAEAAAEIIAEMLNERGEEYSLKFFGLFAGLIEKYVEAADEARVAILLDMDAVFAVQATYYPTELEEDVDVVMTILSCYDNTAEVVPCTMEYNPMCGKDGATYGNPCAMNAAAVEMAHEGACTAEDKPEVCPSNFAPVCGSDGQTYGNFCSLQALGGGAMYLFDGFCEDNAERLTCIEIDIIPTEKPCTREYAPVCGVDGGTYANLCLLENAGVALASEGSC